MDNTTTKPMNLSKDENTLLTMLKTKGYHIGLVQRRSDKPFDLSLTGDRSAGLDCKYEAWLPLSCIREFLNWTQYRISSMCDFPEMVKEGDWSGVRDTNAESIWAIFDKHVLPLISTIVPKDTEYAVKNVKTFQGREGDGFECSLYRDGKKIGTVTDTADGGMIDFYLNKGEREILDVFCMQLPRKPVADDAPDWEKRLYPNGIDIDAEVYVSNLVDKFLNERRLKRKCKTMTLFTLHSDTDPNSMWVMGVRFNEKVRKQLQDKYGDDLKEIINDRFTK